jgi:hypothetical protein
MERNGLTDKQISELNCRREFYKKLGKFSKAAIEVLIRKDILRKSIGNINPSIKRELIENNMIYDYSDLTRNDSIFPTNYKKLLIVQTPEIINGRPTKRFRTIYKANSPKAVGKSLLCDFFDIVFNDLIENGGKFILPTKFKAELCVRAIPDIELKRKRQAKNVYKNVDLFKTKFKYYTFNMHIAKRIDKYLFPITHRYRLDVSMFMYKKLVSKMNTGTHNFLEYKEVVNDWTLYNKELERPKKVRVRRKFNLEYSKKTSANKKIIEQQTQISIIENNNKLFTNNVAPFEKYVEYYVQKLHLLKKYYLLNYEKLVRFFMVALSKLCSSVVKMRPLFFKTNNFAFRIYRWLSKTAYNRIKKRTLERKKQYAKNSNTKHI